MREGGLDRRQLPDIERLHRERKLANMSIVLNCSTQSGRRGYGYGYGENEDGDELQEQSYRKRPLSFLRRTVLRKKHWTMAIHDAT